MSKKIKGVVEFQDVEGGFWSIITDDGMKLRPQIMPEQFKEIGVEVECRVVFVEDDFGFHMWGESVRIVSFKTTKGL